MYYRSVGKQKELCFAVVTEGNALNVSGCLKTLGRTTIGMNVCRKLFLVRRVGGGCRLLFLLTAASVSSWLSHRTQWVGLPLCRNRFRVCFYAVFCTLFVSSLSCHVMLVEGKRRGVTAWGAVDVVRWWYVGECHSAWEAILRS